MEQYLLAGYTGNTVCVSQCTRYLLNQNRIPAKLKKQVNAYQLWHLNTSECNYDVFDSHRRHAAPEQASDQCVAAEQVLVVELDGTEGHGETQHAV